MNSKSIFLGILFLSITTIYSVKAQENTTIGGYLAYGTEVESLGIGANAEFPIAEKLTLSPSFTYFLPEEEFGVSINWFEVNANANYYLVDNEGLGVYAIGGLNYSSVKVSFDGQNLFGPISGNDGRFGLNLGGGANFNLGGSITPFAELKYVVITGGQLVLGAGVRFKI